LASSGLCAHLEPLFHSLGCGFKQVVVHVTVPLTLTFYWLSGLAIA
jgi:hypothetical protein